MYKVAIIGPESTGKSTLARELAEQFKGTYVPEYAREYVERKGRKELTYDEVCEIAREQIRSIRPKDGLSSISEAVHQAEPVFFDTEGSVLLRIAVDCHDVIIVFFKVNTENTVSCPAAVRPKS